MKHYSIRFWLMFMFVSFVTTIFGLGNEMKIVALPEKVRARIGESINVLIQVTNKSADSVIMPSGKLDELGRVLPDIYNVKVRVFKRVGIIAEETELALDGAAVEGSKRGRRLSQGETIVYLVNVFPFQVDSIGTDSVVTIDLGAIFPEKIQVNFQRKQ